MEAAATAADGIIACLERLRLTASSWSRESGGLDEEEKLKMYRESLHSMLPDSWLPRSLVSTLISFSLTTLIPFSLTTLIPFSLTTLIPFSLTTLVPFSLTTLVPFSLTTLVPFL